MRRESEFSGVKNKTGGSSPATARSDLNKYTISLAKNAGAIIVSANEGSENNELEISPLVSYNGEGLESLKGKTLNLPLYISQL